MPGFWTKRNGLRNPDANVSVHGPVPGATPVGAVQRLAPALPTYGLPLGTPPSRVTRRILPFGMSRRRLFVLRAPHFVGSPILQPPSPTLT